MGLSIYFEKVSHPRKRRKNETLSNYLSDISNKYDVTNVGYLRKVSSIYKYFSEKMDADKCIVKKEELIDIIDKATKVLSERDAKTSEELLPIEIGFFFGTSSYDEYYYSCIRNTLFLFERMLSDWNDKDVLFISVSK